MLEQCALIKVRLSGDDFGTFGERELVFAIEDDLHGFFESSDSGEFDGQEFGGGWGGSVLLRLGCRNASGRRPASCAEAFIPKGLLRGETIRPPE